MSDKDEHDICYACIRRRDFLLQSGLPYFDWRSCPFKCEKRDEKLKEDKKGK